MPTATASEVTVQVSDLEAIRATLNSCWHQNTVLDLTDQYRKMSARPQASPLTKGIESTKDLVSQYIRAAEEDEDA